MRLPSPLVVGTAAVLVSVATAASAAPSAPAASATAPPAPKPPSAPAAPAAAPSTPAPAAGSDVPTQAAPDRDAAAEARDEPSTKASSTPPAAPVVPSASIRRRVTAAAPPPKRPIVGDVEEEVKPARDTVGGHVAIGVNAGLVLPFGSISSGVPQSRTMGVGWSFGADLAYGISRTVMLGAYADVGLPEWQGPPSSDEVISNLTIAAGPLVRYHLVQGVSFDPWVAGGIGFRHTGGATTLNGIDWVRLSLGGDWYPAPNLGFGPILELSLGTFFAESPGPLPSKALNAHFVAGVRVVFDTPGK